MTREPLSKSPRRESVWMVLPAVALAALGFGFGFLSDPVRAWGSLLISNFYVLALALGALFFVAMLSLLEAGWWVALRRIPEAMTTALPWVMLPMLALFLGRHELYHWSEPHVIEHDAVLASKASFLNTPFFFLRMVIILGLWAAFAFRLRHLSLAGEGEEIQRARKRLSAFFIITFAVTLSLASFDWLMSLEPHWFSTIFGVYTFAGVFLGALAAITVTVVLLRGPLHRLAVLREEHFHDLGKLLFAFSTFWAYIWLSQYLLIWYSHLPEEIPHYVTRMQNGWSFAFFLNFFLNWVIPFVVLLPQATKRRPKVLLAVALVILAGRWLDLYLHVMPALGRTPWVAVSDVALFLGFTGVFVYLTRRALMTAPLVAKQDPLLGESLSYHS